MASRLVLPVAVLQLAPALLVVHRLPRLKLRLLRQTLLQQTLPQLTLLLQKAKSPLTLPRLPLLPKEAVGADMLPTPIKFVGEELPVPTMAPTVGEHTEAVLRTVLGWSDDQIAAARAAGAFGKTD